MKILILKKSSWFTYGPFLSFLFLSHLSFIKANSDKGWITIKQIKGISKLLSRNSFLKARETC